MKFNFTSFKNGTKNTLKNISGVLTLSLTLLSYWMKLMYVQQF